MNKLFTLMIFFLIYGVTIEKQDISEGTKNQSFCGVNYLKYKITKPTSLNTKNSNSKIRRLSTNWSQIRIFVDTTFLDYQAESNEVIKPFLPNIKRALKKAVKGITELINVEQYKQSFFSYVNETLLNQFYISKWANEINNPEEMTMNYDYILLTRFEKNEFPSGVLAAAMPILMHPETNRPMAGLMMVSTSPDFFEKSNVEEYFSKIFIHELTHAFGFLNDAFKYFPGGREQTLLTKIVNNIERTYIKTKKVIEVAKKYFGCNSIDGVEVEDQGTGGSAISHWESRILLGEYMTSVTYEDEMAISDFTLALLEDSGWYKPNYYSGGLMRFGKNKGCAFLTSQCIDYNTRNSYFEDEFFSYSMEWYSTCTTGRQSRAYNLFSHYRNLDKQYLVNIIPYDYNNGYFVGGIISSADYCPVPYHLNPEYQNSYFVGNCKFGNGNYGTNLYYFKEGTTVKNIPNNKIPEEFGEKYSDNSFCMMSSLVPKEKNDYSYFGTIFHPMCYPVYCSSSSLTVLIYNQYVVCPRQGGNVELDGFTGKLHCPDYNLICSGTVVCNDLFDCIDKKSLTKESSYNYDYKPISTQNNIKIVQSETLLVGELSKDGICPINCAQCNSDNKICKKCGERYILVGIKENDGLSPMCQDTNSFSKVGYYIKNNIYYPCHTKCSTCSEGPSSDTSPNCDSCKEGFSLDKNKNCIDSSEKESSEKESSNFSTILIIILVIALVIIIFIVSFIIIRKLRLKNSDSYDAITNANQTPLY